MRHPLISAGWRAAAATLLVTGCGRPVPPASSDGGVDGGAPLFAPLEVPEANFFAVAGSSSANVVIVGGGGAILRWDGTRLGREESPTTADLRGVAVVNDRLAWAVGTSGTVVRWDGAVWTVADAGTKAHLNAVWANETRMVAVGAKGAAIAFDTKWSLLPTSSPDDLYGLSSSPQGLFAVGSLGTIAKFDGKSFRRVAVPGYAKTLAGATSGPGGTFVVGLGGAVFRYDSLAAIAGLPPVFLRGVAAPAGGEVWVAGFDGVVARLGRDGKWQLIADLPMRWYEGVYAAAADDVWVVGNAGTVLRSRRAMAGGDGGAPADSGAPIRDGGGGG